MPRSGLDPEAVVGAAAVLADVGRALQRRVGAGVLARIGAIDVRHSRERIAAGAPRDRRLQRGAQLAGAADGEPATDVGQPLHVGVQRRRAYAKALREARERDGLEALGVRQLRRRGDYGLRIQAGPGH